MILEEDIIPILFIIYGICVLIEIIALKRNQIKLFYKENFWLALLISGIFPLAIFSLIFGFRAIQTISLEGADKILITGYFATYVLVAVFYIIYDVRRKIYALLPYRNKWHCEAYKTIYDKEEKEF